MKIMIAGDTHCDIQHLKYLMNICEEQDIHHLIQVGDFNYYPRLDYGEIFLLATASMARKRDIDLFFIDGNHEDHEMLEELVRSHGGESFIPVEERIFYIPRGMFFSFEGIEFVGYGGAYSVNRAQLIKNISWFDGEMISEAHVNSIPDRKVDVMISHEIPDAGLDWYGDPWSHPVQLQSMMQRRLLSEVFNKTQPQLVFAGHHHRHAVMRLQHRNGITWTHVLNKNKSMHHSWHILDTDNLQKSKG